MLKRCFEEHLARAGLHQAGDHRAMVRYINTGQGPLDRDAAAKFASMLAFCALPDLKSLQEAKAQYGRMARQQGSSKVPPEALLAMLLPGAGSSAILRLAPVFAAAYS